VNNLEYRALMDRFAAIELRLAELEGEPSVGMLTPEERIALTGKRGPGRPRKNGVVTA